jgi:hypothetical protein
MGIELSFGLAAVCFIPFGASRRILFFGQAGRGARTLRNIMLSVMGLALVLGMFACGGGGSNNNNNNNFTTLSGTVTVQAVSGSLTHTVSIPVTIN